jgi:hypothetical protein
MGGFTFTIFAEGFVAGALVAAMIAFFRAWWVSR